MVNFRIYGFLVFIFIFLEKIYINDDYEQYFLQVILFLSFLTLIECVCWISEFLKTRFFFFFTKKLITVTCVTFRRINFFRTSLSYNILPCQVSYISFYYFGLNGTFNKYMIYLNVNYDYEQYFFHVIFLISFLYRLE